MTRGEPRSDPSLYEADFFLWTQRQAAMLRAMPRGATLDIDHLAEEIEDLGERDLRTVMSLLERLIEHLLKISAYPQSPSAPHRASEIVAFQREAVRHFAPGMRRLLDAEAIWQAGRETALAFSERSDVPVALPSRNPFTLEDLLAAPFDTDAALAAISRVADTPTSSRPQGAP